MTVFEAVVLPPVSVVVVAKVTGVLLESVREAAVRVLTAQSRGGGGRRR